MLTVLAHKSHQLTICTPYHILHQWTVQLSDGLLLLKVIKNNGGRGAENETRGTTIEYLISLYRWLDGFHDRIGQVPDFN